MSLGRVCAYTMPHWERRSGITGNQQVCWPWVWHSATMTVFFQFHFHFASFHYSSTFNPSKISCALVHILPIPKFCENSLLRQLFELLVHKQTQDGSETIARISIGGNNKLNVKRYIIYIYCKILSITCAIFDVIACKLSRQFPGSDKWSTKVHLQHWLSSWLIPTDIDTTAADVH